MNLQFSALSRLVEFSELTASTWQIREGAELPDRDLEEVVNLINEVYWLKQKTFFKDCPEARARTSAEEIRIIAKGDNDSKLFVALDIESKIAGAIVFDSAMGHEYAKFGPFAIAPAYLGKGAGQQLLSYVENLARLMGKTHMKIEVFTFANSLCSYYEKLGYQLTGHAKTFLHDEFILEQYKETNNRYLLEMQKTL